MALMKFNRTIWLVVVVLAGQQSARSGTLRKIWELDLRKIISGAPSASAKNLPVQLIAFSPDGRQLAVAVAWDTSRKVFKSKLFVIEPQAVGSSARQFEISAGIGNEEMPGPSLFGWSPNGKILFAAGKVIHLRDGTSCEPPPGWTSLIDDNHLVLNQLDPYDAVAIRAQRDAIQELLKASGGRPIASSKVPSVPERKSHLRFLDAECQPQGAEWQVAEEWEIHDVSTERRLLAVTRRRGFMKNEFLIVDPVARTIIRRWPPGSGIGGQFAEGGKALCEVGEVEDTPRAPLTCWDVDSGNRIGGAPHINGGVPMATAAYSSRIVASDYQRIRDPMSANEYGQLLKRRVVWARCGPGVVRRIIRMGRITRGITPMGLRLTTRILLPG